MAAVVVFLFGNQQYLRKISCFWLLLFWRSFQITSKQPIGALRKVMLRYNITCYISLSLCLSLSLSLSMNQWQPLLFFLLGNHAKYHFWRSSGIIFGDWPASQPARSEVLYCSFRKQPHALQASLQVRMGKLLFFTLFCIWIWAPSVLHSKKLVDFNNSFKNELNWSLS